MSDKVLVMNYGVGFTQSLRKLTEDGESVPDIVVVSQLSAKRPQEEKSDDGD